MRRVSQLLMTVALSSLFVLTPSLATRSAVAQSAPTMNLWRLFGIPAGVHHLRDATANRFGKHPGLERTDPLLRLADPANLVSDNPAIKVAAEAKADADLTEQKIKAIRYLAEIGCECSAQSDTIEDALLAALDDCSEQVRYEAALAFCATTGQTCGQCNRKSCCSAESLRKLHEIATGREDNGCWKETSANVRRVAGSAFERCRRSFDYRPTPAVPVDPKETVDQPRPGEGPLDVEPAPVEPGPALEPFDADLEELLSAPSTGMASSLGAASGPQGTGLYMMGDFPGVSGGRVTPYYLDGYQNGSGTIPIPPAVLRSAKISENYSSIPRDRLFFNHSYFNNTVLGTGAPVEHINRYVFGIEKTFCCDMASLELRIPFGSTLNSDQRLDGVDFTNVEYGNTVIIGKAILHQTRNYVLAGGLGIGLPTGDDTRIMDGNSLRLRLDNDAYHIAPFLGIAATPTKNTFMETFIQVDAPLNDNDVKASDWAQSAHLPDQSILFADLSMGYWLYKEPMSPNRLKGLAPVVELHYSTSLDGPVTIGDPAFETTIENGNHFGYLNMTCGMHCVFAHGGTVSPGIVIPLLGETRQFDYEMQVQLNLPY